MKNKKNLIAAGALVLTGALGSVQYAFADNKTAAAVETVSESSTHQKKIETLFQNIFLLNIKPEIGKIEHDKSSNKIIAHDVKIATEYMNAVYKKVEIFDFKELGQGEYSISKLELTDLQSKITEKTRQTIKQDLEKNGAAQKSPELTQFLEGEGFLFKKLVYEGIQYSEKQDFVLIKSGFVRGFEMPEGLPVDFSKLEADFKNFRMGNLKEFRKINEMLVNYQTEMSKSPQEFLNKISSLYSSFEAEDMTVRGLPVFPSKKGGTIKIGEVSISNWKNGIIGEVAMKDMHVYEPDARDMKDIRFGKIALNGIQITDLIKHSASLNKSRPANPMDGIKVFHFIKGLSLTDIDTKGAQSDFKGSMSFNWDNFVGLFPTKVGIKLNADVKPPSAETQQPSPLEAILAVTGLKSLDNQLNIGIEWDEKTQKIVFKPFSYDVDKMLSLSISASLENITKEMVAEQDPNKLLIFAMGANVGAFTIEVSDKGVLKLYNEQHKATWEAMSAQFAADPNMKPVVDAINKFLADPSGKLKITLTPKGPVNVSQVITAVNLGPAMMFTLYDLKAEHIAAN